MKMNLRGGALLVIGMVLAGAASAADEAGTSTRPPTNLKLVGDHWTPWSPPAAGPDDYIIQSGDTLWALAGQWLEDPYLWPQVWEQNKYILDSHWIYPGDPLVRPSKPTVVPAGGPPPGEERPSAVTPAPAASNAPSRPTQPAASSVPAPARLMPYADTSDLYCTGYIDPSHETPPMHIVGVENERINVGEGDVVYVSAGKSQGVRAGAQYAVRRNKGPVVHPVTGQALGAMIGRVGRLRILAVQEQTSTAIIDMSCAELSVNDEVVPWEDFAAPMLAALPQMDPYDVTPSGGTQGYVVAARDNISDTGSGHVIFTDLGAISGLQPGAILTVYRPNAELPRLMLGRAVVLAVEDGTSTVKIVQARREIRMGDRVEVYR